MPQLDSGSSTIQFLTLAKELVREDLESQPVPPLFPEPKENKRRKSSERTNTICDFICKYVGDRFGDGVAAQRDQENGQKLEFPRQVTLPTMRAHGDADTRSTHEKHRQSERQKWKWVSVGKKDLAEKHDKETYCPCVSIGFAWSFVFHVGEAAARGLAWKDGFGANTKGSNAASGTDSPLLLLEVQNSFVFSYLNHEQEVAYATPLQTINVPVGLTQYA